MNGQDEQVHLPGADSLRERVEVEATVIDRIEEGVLRQVRASDRMKLSHRLVIALSVYLVLNQDASSLALGPSMAFVGLIVMIYAALVDQ